MCKVGTFNPSYIKNVLIPFFDKLEWISKKFADYEDWKILFYLKENGWHHSEEGCEVLLAIANRMNLNRLSTSNKNLHSTFGDSKIKFFLENSNLESHADGKIWIKSKEKYLSTPLGCEVGRKKTKIGCFNEDGILIKNFDSLTEAAQYFNLSKGTISNKLNGGSLLLLKGEQLKLIREAE